jgi:hypothetical protein
VHRPIGHREKPIFYALITNSSEYKEGEAAFCRGLTTRNNPYPFLSPEYWRWHEGLLGNARPRKWQVNSEPYVSGVVAGDDADGFIEIIVG